VQVEPMKPKLKAPGSKRAKRLKLKFDNLPSSFAFRFNLRRYSEVVEESARLRSAATAPGAMSAQRASLPAAAMRAEILTAISGGAAVGRCRLNR